MTSVNPMDTIHDDGQEELVKEITEKVVADGIESITDMIPDDVPPFEIDEDEDEDVEENLPAQSSGTLPIDEGETIVLGKKMSVEMNDDFHSIRDNLKDMIASGMQDLESLSTLARTMEHPRVYEVLCTMMNTMRDLNNQLLTMNEKKHKIITELEPAGEGAVRLQHNIDDDDTGKGTNIQNAVFVGSTADLQEFFRQQGLSGGGAPQGA